jgi:hypothetical protein
MEKTIKKLEEEIKKKEFERLYASEELEMRKKQRKRK